MFSASSDRLLPGTGHHTIAHADRLATLPNPISSFQIFLTCVPEVPTMSPIVASAPARPTPVDEIADALERVPPLQGLSFEDRLWLAQHSEEIVAQTGEVLFEENTPADRMVLILKGEIHVQRQHSGPMALFIGRAGQMTGLLPFSRMKTFGGQGVAVSDVWALLIPKSLFPEMLAAIPSMAQRVVSTLLDRVREVTRIEQQAEKLNALGKLAGNLAHELNNPASAAQRAAASLFGELREYGELKYRLGNLCLSEEEIAGYRAWVQNARARMSAFSSHSQGPQSPLAVTDNEAALVRWLEAHNVPRAWTIAPALSETNLPIDLLDELAAITRPEVL